MDPQHRCGLRLFSGFSEGSPELVVDLYAETLVLHSYADPPESGTDTINTAMETARETIPWARAGILKSRNSSQETERRGVMLFGTKPSTSIEENGVHYALDLTMHQDCSLYLDTRGLREWSKQSLRGLTVLNAFAYSGSLGAAALSGGARHVVQLDRTRRFLDLGRATYALNGFPILAGDFLQGDFFREAGRLRRQRVRFDCVFLDPPFFAASHTGKVDLEEQSARLINKIRPLVIPGGRLVAINNALFVSGAAYIDLLEGLCRDGHMKIDEIVPVPPDSVGMLPALGPPITDPAPFNHSTKIAVLRVI